MKEEKLKRAIGRFLDFWIGDPVLKIALALPLNEFIKDILKEENKK